jgi:hypothetical protein
MDSLAKNRVFILIAVFTFTLFFGCNPKSETPFQNTSTNLNQSPSFVFSPEIYAYPSWLSGCDRFRQIFKKELEKYPLLQEVFDIPVIYSITYHETFCQTTDELHDYFIEKGIKDDGWKGGIMQVDGCWRWGSPYDCSTVEKQIENGVAQLNFSYSKIDEKIREYGLSDILSEQDKISLFLIAYNRGYYVSNQGLLVYSHKLKTGNFLIEPFTSLVSGSMLIYVNCTEKDLCIGDYSYIDISDEMQNFTTDFEKSLLISCKKNYGLMRNEQGDYCTGPGYGLMYPKPVFRVLDAINLYQNTSRDSSWIPDKEMEFYIGEVNFSGYKWFAKKSLGKT